MTAQQTSTYEEWNELTTALGTARDHLLMLLADPSVWNDDAPLQGGIVLVAHRAYNLGEVRRSFCTLRR